MTDLERLFRRLVDNLIAIDPARLHRPIALADLLNSIIPYRTNRRSLSIDSAEDYDMLVLRLCSGEGGYVQMASEDIAQVFRDQVTSPNPDLGILREHPRAELMLGTEPLAHALGPGPEEQFAPPDEDDPPAATSPAPAPTAAPAPVLQLESSRRVTFSAEPASPAVILPPPPRIVADMDPPSSRRDATGPRCSFCGGKLPSGRAVNFCPHCGQNQSMVRCPNCQAEIEIDWKHCVSCGHFVAE
jgi:hypothetical protein